MRRKVAHRYTDGAGYGGGLPRGCGHRCDVNPALGLNAVEYARACGSTATESVPIEVGL